MARLRGFFVFSKGSKGVCFADFSIYGVLLGYACGSWNSETTPRGFKYFVAAWNLGKRRALEEEEEDIFVLKLICN